MIAPSVDELLVDLCDDGDIECKQGGVSLKPTQTHLKSSRQELQLSGERLHFRKIEGDGPDAGWVSTRPEWVCLNAAPACFTFPGNGG